MLIVKNVAINMIGKNFFILDLSSFGQEHECCLHNISQAQCRQVGILAII
jgi:hypothetical protein